MRKYLNPEFEMMVLEVKDIVTASLTDGGIDDTTAPPGGNIVICSDDMSIWSDN